MLVLSARRDSAVRILYVSVDDSRLLRCLVLAVLSETPQKNQRSRFARDRPQAQQEVTRSYTFEFITMAITFITNFQFYYTRLFCLNLNLNMKIVKAKRT